MKEIILASNNHHKAREISQILGLKVLNAKDFVKDFDPVENGASFKQNAKIKAKALYEKLSDDDKKRYMVLSDDSGLCVDELDGEPGIYSARYAKNYDEKSSIDAQNRQKLKEELDKKGLKNASGAFICVLCLIDDGKMEFFKGVLDGIITQNECGENGFGYDSMFLVKDKTLAQMSEDKKNLISHRYKALLYLKDFLDTKANN